MAKFADLRAQIDVEIRDLEARLSTLRTTRNTLAPINQFPAEVLARIFKLVPGPKDDATKILPITWVAQHWRQIALDYARLWTILDNSNFKRECLETWLARSKSSPLLIRISRDFGYHRHLLPLALSQSDRVTCLWLSGSSTWQLEHLDSAWTTPTISSLQELRLNYCLYSKGIPASTASTLQSLLLERCEMDIRTAFIPSSLTTLSIIFPARYIDATLFMQRIADMPNLKTLILDHALQKDKDGVQHVSMSNIQLDFLILRWMSPATQKWLLEQDLIRPGTTAVVSFSKRPLKELQTLISTVRGAISSGHRVPIAVDVVKILDLHHSNYRISVMYGKGDGDPAQEIGNVEVIIDTPTENIVLDVLTCLDLPSASEHLKVIRVQQDATAVKGGFPDKDLPPNIAHFISNLTHVQYVHLRMPFAFIQAFLFSCVRARQNPSDGTLETLIIETLQPPQWKFGGDTCFLREPIKTLVLNHSHPLVEFSAFAEQVVIAGSQSHRQLHVEFPIQVPRHSFQSFTDLEER
ncbi:hypothetical protein BDN72DRAFT_836917 [Pluteus cervinus]|uniref:Uncharacterized protein n=1 Tax=Pluteus cervinus TaxID=181527 RepID=A0ACD3B302_9AGAR|nr:hypothetical protein BDN72DRAFT_836917 [Pluteus cervinus]